VEPVIRGRASFGSASDTATKQQLTERLAKIEGHVRGVAKMVEERGGILNPRQRREER